jgi:hypothetical protein
MGSEASCEPWMTIQGFGKSIKRIDHNRASLVLLLDDKDVCGKGFSVDTLQTLRHG